MSIPRAQKDTMTAQLRPIFQGATFSAFDLRIYG